MIFHFKKDQKISSNIFDLKKINEARFARNVVKCDFLSDFQIQSTPDLVNVNIVNSLDLVNFSLLTDFL